MEKLLGETINNTKRKGISRMANSKEKCSIPVQISMCHGSSCVFYWFHIVQTAARYAFQVSLPKPSHNTILVKPQDVFD